MQVADRRSRSRRRRACRRAELPPEQPRRSGIRRTRSPTTRRRRCASRCPPGTASSAAAQPQSPATVVTLRDLATPCRPAKRSRSAPAEPLRYLAVVVSRFTRVGEATLACRDDRPPDAGVDRSTSPSKRTRASVPRRATLIAAGGRHPAVLRVAGRRCAVRVGDGRAASRATCPAATAPATSPSSTARCRRSRIAVAQRPGGVRGLPRLLPRPRARAPVVGTGGRLEELPRAVAQRGVRAVLRGALRAEDARRARRSSTCCASSAAGRLTESDQGPGPPRLPARPHQGRRPHLPRAGLQQGRGGPAHAAAAARRRGLLQRAAPVLRRSAVPEGRHRRPRRAFEAESGRRSIASSSGGSTAPTSRASATPQRSATATVTVRFEQAARPSSTCRSPSPITYANGRTRRRCPGHRGRSSGRSRRPTWSARCRSTAIRPAGDRRSIRAEKRSAAIGGFVN